MVASLKYISFSKTANFFFLSIQLLFSDSWHPKRPAVDTQINVTKY